MVDHVDIINHDNTELCYFYQDSALTVQIYKAENIKNYFWKFLSAAVEDFHVLNVAMYGVKRSKYLYVPALP